MIESPSDGISIMLARQALLLQLVRVLFRERAAQHGQSREDIVRWGEEMKIFFENRVPVGVAEAHLSAAIDQFVAVLAAEVAEDRGAAE